MVSNNEIRETYLRNTDELEKLKRKLEKKKALNVSVVGRVFPKFRFTKALEKTRVYIHGGVGAGKSMLMDLFFKYLNLKKKEDPFS